MILGEKFTMLASIGHKLQIGTAAAILNATSYALRSQSLTFVGLEFH